MKKKNRIQAFQIRHHDRPPIPAIIPSKIIPKLLQNIARKVIKGLYVPEIFPIADYLRATLNASEKRVSRYPSALCSVLVARFRHGIGPRFHSLFELARLKRERWNDYLLDENLRQVLRRVNPPASRQMVDDKLAFQHHCLKSFLKTIPVVCAIDNQSAASPEQGAQIASEQDWINALDAGPDALFIKLIDGTWGIDAFVAQRIRNMWTYCGRQGSAGDLYRFTMDRLAGRRGWIIQPVVRTHVRLREISSPNGLCTIRAVTCLDRGKCDVLFAVLRIPVGSNITDNFAHGTSGNLISPIDLRTGILGPCRGSTSRDWPNMVEVPMHPDTGNRIQGTAIPSWPEVLDLLARAQTSMPFLATLGWDIAVTDEGPVIVEANATYDVDLIQVAHRRGIGPELCARLPQSLPIQPTNGAGG